MPSPPQNTQPVAGSTSTTARERPPPVPRRPLTVQANRLAYGLRGSVETGQLALRRGVNGAVTVVGDRPNRPAGVFVVAAE